MNRRVFISYSHAQKDWVRNSLAPCLRAGGAEVLVDQESFRLGTLLTAQMDESIDQADRCVVVMSPDYLNSPNCLYELDRAITRDPTFENGFLVPIKLVDFKLPSTLHLSRSLYANLTDQADSHAWTQVLDACGVTLGATAPDWLNVRDFIVRSLERQESVNLLVTGAPKWRPLLEHLRADFFPQMGMVDLDRGTTASRRALVANMLASLGISAPTPPEPEDLVHLDQSLSNRAQSRLAILHFDRVSNRPYGPDLWKALRFLVMESRRLSLLLVSRAPVAAILPIDQVDSPIALQTVELREKS